MKQLVNKLWDIRRYVALLIAACLTILIIGLVVFGFRIEIFALATVDFFLFISAISWRLNPM